jgi:hypothetical protein
MTRKPHPAIAMNERVVRAFDSLTSVVSQEGIAPDRVIRLIHDIGHMLKTARESGFVGVLHQAEQSAKSFYQEATVQLGFMYDSEDFQEIMDSMAWNLPIPNHGSLRFYLAGSPRCVLNAVTTYTASANVYEHFTLKQDIAGITRSMGANGKDHGEAALMLMHFLADLSKVWPQILPPVNVNYVIAAYYYGLKETPDIDINHKMGLLLNEFAGELDKSPPPFDLPRVEDAIALHRHGYPSVAAKLLQNCFPRSYNMKHTQLLEFEREMGYDVSSFVDKIKGTHFTHEDHRLHTSMLLMHFLASEKTLVSFEDLHLSTSKVTDSILGWIETALVNYKDSVIHENVKTTITFLLDHRPHWAEEMKKLPGLRDFLKNFEFHSADLLAEDLGL